MVRLLAVTTVVRMVDLKADLTVDLMDVMMVE